MGSSTSRTLTEIEELQSFNPADGSILWQGAASTQEQVNEAVMCARQAAPMWAATPLEERLAIIETFGTLLKEKKASFSQWVSLEMGKPKWEADTEVGAMVGKIAISIQSYQERCASLDQTLPNGNSSSTRHKPHGVVAVYGPYNFPGHLPNGHIVPALIAGNTLVFKPSELTPKVGEMMVELWKEAGLPKGVLNLVQGSASVGATLAQHPDIDGLFFTGSSRTGLLLHEQFATQPQKILALEMGGNNPLVIGNTQEIDAAVVHILQSAYITSGQRCTCARRLIIQKGKSYQQLMDRLLPAIQNMRIGTFQEDPQPFMGPVVSTQAATQLLQAQEKLKEKGGEPLLSMARLKEGTGLLSPGLMDVSSISQLPDEENFGPFLQVIQVENFDESLVVANQTKFGLSAAIFTEDKEEYHRFYQSIRAGIVNWNTQTTGASSRAPFGGVGISGNHRPSAYYAADYCAYPVASVEAEKLSLPSQLPPGLEG